MAVLVLLSLVCAAFATKGVDLSQATSQDSFSCLHSNGYNFAIVRCYESVGQPDPNCAQSVINAWNGGMAHVDIYMFPDPTAGNPAGQVDSLVSYLDSHGIHIRTTPPQTYGMLWLDIEGVGYWTGDQGANQNFFNGLVNQAKAHGLYLGIYTSRSQWDPIMGSFSGGAAYPLWYAHYDGDASFNDFAPFGGWSSPAIKQFQGTTGLCSAGVDLSWYPDFKGVPGRWSAPWYNMTAQ
eukprot:m.222402 g.222402  ORF g.222402 m.222402 type:complete len:237 (-) comp16021_c0_seq1:138-848(-)